MEPDAHRSLSSRDHGVFEVRSLTGPIFLPNFLFAIGRGAAVPVVALLALELGASPAVAAAVVALRGAGTMIFDLPAGVLVSRVGERRALILTGLTLAVVSLAISLGPTLWLYAVLVALIGCTWSVWHIARIAFAAGASPVRHRGRVMAMLGGSTRIGLLVGPLLGSVVVAAIGLNGVFVLVAVVSVAAAGALSISRPIPFTPEPPVQGRRPTLGRVLADHRHALAAAGSVVLIVQALRSAREAVLPLWADQLGIGASTVPLIFAASYAVESLLFYPVGILMDRKGRKWAFVPCIALLSIGVGVIPLTSDLASLTGAAMLIGLANGFGAGMNMTLGSDLSPLAGRSRFLGVWRLITDVGNVGGPLVVTALTSAATLAVAAYVLGGVGVLGVLGLLRLVPETLVTTET